MRTQKTAVMTFLMMTGLAHAGSKEAMPVVTIRVENEARVDERIVREAQKEAVAILARAGVKLIWADCGRGGSDWESREACKHSRGPNEFWMQITMDRPHWSPRKPWASRTSPTATAPVEFITRQCSLWCAICAAKRLNSWQQPWSTKSATSSWAQMLTPTQGLCAVTGARNSTN